MIYVDTSVILAWLLAEDHRPSSEFFNQNLIASRLLRYEVLNRLQTYEAKPALRLDAIRVLEKINLIKLTDDVLARAERPFPRHVRTLDALHLATAAWVAEQEPSLQIATFDKRMAETAEAIGIRTFVFV